MTFSAGIAQDATQITVSTTPDPLTPLPSGSVAASPSVHIEIPANALQSNIPLGAGITVEIPVGPATAAGAAFTAGNTLDAFKIVGVKISRSAQVTWGYAKYSVTTTYNGTKKATIWLGAKYLNLIYAAGNVGGSAIVTLDVVVQNVQACFQGPQLNKLYHVLQLPGQVNSPDIYSANGSLNFPLAQTVNPNKIPLVLVHGIQMLGLESCTDAYKNTWATFIANFYNSPELVNKYQLFTYSYDTSLAIRDDVSGEGSGRNFAQNLLAVIGSKKAVVVAHSMGGLVSRSALTYDSAPIESLITLGTPHHGTTLRNIDELLVIAGVTSPNPQIAATVLSAEGAWFVLLDVNGARQLDWDNFDNKIPSCNLSAGQTCNKFIKDMNSIDSNLARYSLFAGLVNDPLVKSFYAIVGFPDGAGDTVVPTVSALLQDYFSLNAPQYTDKPIFSGKTYIFPFGHSGIHDDPSWPLVYPQNPNSVFATIQNLLLLPSAPTGISATAGDGQATISWNADAGVTYNLYMASASGVTKSTYSALTNGMQHIGVTAPYTHTGLTNGTAYYFVVTAVNGYGESGESAQVSATPQALPTVSLTASPSSIAYGATSSLSWSSTNSTSCTSAGGGGTGTAGTFTTPALTATTIYTVTCTGPGGTASQSATVTVAGALAPTVSLTASPSSIAYGATSTLNWSSTNSTSCASAGGGGTGTAGTFTTPALTATTIYTVTCTGPGGTASQSATVTVAAQASTLNDTGINAIRQAAMF